MATHEEVIALFDFFKEANDDELRALISKSFEDNNTINNEYNYILQVVKERVIQQAIDSTNNVIPLKKRATKVWYYAAAACAAAVITLTAILYFNKPNAQYEATDLKPGENRAALALDKHDTLQLQNKQAAVLLSKPGFAITHTKTGTIVYSVNNGDTADLNKVHTLITPRGGQYHVQLSDGTEVLLNSESKLEFTVGFTGKERRVKLTGEAYFEVAHNKERPFIVSTNGEDVQVLGTKFNISNYPEDDGPVTTLLQGSVKVTTPSAVAMLKPGQQSRITPSAINVSDVETDQFSAWKDGDFVFENTPMDQIMHKLARWYDFDTDYSKLPNNSYYIKISKQVNLSEVLRMITVTSGVKFKIEGRRVMVM